MWIMTTEGFYSAVAHRDYEDLVLVRARSRDDLVRLIERAAPHSSLTVDDIAASPKADYPFRVIMTRALFATVTGELANAIDYDNFKDAIARRQGPSRAYTYHEVWHVLHAITRERPAKRAAKRAARKAVK